MSSDDPKKPEEGANPPDQPADHPAGDTQPEQGPVPETADAEQAPGAEEPQSGAPESASQPADNDPADNDPADNEPADNAPADNAPADNEPAESAPADAPAHQPRAEPFTGTPEDTGDPSATSDPEASSDATTDSAKSESEPSTSDSYYDDPYDDDYHHESESESKSTTTALATTGGTPPPPPPSGDDEDDSGEEEDGMARMSFLEHLEELRKRIIQSLIGLGIAYALCLLFATQLFGWMTQPVKRAFEMLEGICEFDAPLKLVALTPSEQFNLIYLKVPLLAAVFLASPWLVYQAWAFIAPGLYQRERRWARPFIFCIAGLFVLGGAFGYFVVLRYALTFLIGIGCEIDIQPMITVSSYFSTFVMVELGLGIVFQMPVLIFFLTLLRIVNPTFLLENLRYAILVIFITAAVITPTPDVFNMILFAAPMILLFYVGIGASYLLILKREKGKIPWIRIILVSLAILAVVTAGVLFFMHNQLGYQFVDQFPWFVAPE